MTRTGSLLSARGVFAFCLAIFWPDEAYAMHIIEGYLPVSYCIFWTILSLPFLWAGIRSIRALAATHRAALLLLAMAGAYVFLLSALKIPSVTGSSSHPTGTGLGAILFGPAPMAVVGLLVLVFQAILLAHGGLSTLGANVCSMAVAGPYAAYGVYRVCLLLRAPRRVGVFLAAAVGALVTYMATSLQLALAYPDAVGGVGAAFFKFMSVFALTQLPLAIIEGLLTVAVIIGLESWAGPELAELGYARKEDLS